MGFVKVLLAERVFTLSIKKKIIFLSKYGLIKNDQIIKGKKPTKMPNQKNFVFIIFLL